MIDWQEAPISARHDRLSFTCGVDELDRYLRAFARQNHERGGARTFVAVPRAEPARIIGYYSLTATSIEFDDTPEDLRRGLGRYPMLVFVLARLAVDRSSQGLGLGRALLMKAGEKALAASDVFGGIGMLIDAKDDAAARWYMRFGARALPSSQLSLIIPFDDLRHALDRV